MKKAIICSAYILIILFNHYNNVNAFDDAITHPDLTVSAVKSSKLDTYLKDNLGYQNGISATLPSYTQNTILTILQRGAIAEDHPLCRASNHFLDPLKTWDKAYMTDMPSLFAKYCDSQGWTPPGGTYPRYSNVT